MKTLLVIGAGVEPAIAIQIAKRMGLYVVASDRDPNAPGFKFADDRIIASTMDPNETTKAAIRFNKKRKIDGVITVACDAPHTVASVAKALGLPGISMKTATLSRNKLMMKQKFKKNNVAIPWFKEISSANELGRLAKEKSFPLIIKPIDSRGARGVIKINGKTNIRWAFNASKKESPTGRVMAEEFIRGPQISTEALVYNGKVYVLGYADRNYEYIERFAPYIIENGGETPTRYLKKHKKQIDIVFSKAIRSLGIVNGVGKGDLVLTKDGPKVIEIAARLSGGYFCTDSIPIVTGVNIVEKAIKIALGEKLHESELKPRYMKAAANRFLFPKPGIVNKISGIDKVKKLNWVKRIGIYVKIGEKIGPITDHTKRAGFVLVGGKNWKDAKNKAEKAINMIKIETK